MSESGKSHQCLQCGASSDERVLLACEAEGKDAYVCVRCLPVLIHGAH
jgi:hypothetical protein